MTALALEIEFLTGTYRGARGPGDAAADWPPQPDRIYSALVSTWAGRGERPAERTALEWLEAQPAPTLHASAHTDRSAPKTYVPPNDPRAGRRHLQVVPDYRLDKPRRFPTARPDDARMLVVWDARPTGALLDALNAIAADVSYLGTTVSLVRCRFTAEDAPPGAPATRTVYPGRLPELERAYHARPERPAIAEGMPVFDPAPDHPTTAATSTTWLPLEIVDGGAPDVLASAPLARTLRDTLMSGYRRAGRPIPEAVSGHGPGGRPSERPHLAIAPLAFAGYPRATGKLLGLALVAPRDTALETIPGWTEAWAALTRPRPQDARPVLTLASRALERRVELATVFAGETRRAFDAQPYLGPAAVWATATPIVLDRHLKRGDDDETLRRIIARACGHAGLPRPARVSTDRLSAIRGMPPARPLRSEPPWARWRLPRSAESRQLTHAVIEFTEPVAGPVLIGAGRYAGLGLCRAIRAGP